MVAAAMACTAVNSDGINFYRDELSTMDLNQAGNDAANHLQQNYGMQARSSGDETLVSWTRAAVLISNCAITH